MVARARCSDSCCRPRTRVSRARRLFRFGAVTGLLGWAGVCAGVAAAAEAGLPPGWIPEHAYTETVVAPAGYEVSDYYTLAVLPVFADEPGVHAIEVRTSIVYSEVGSHGGIQRAAGDGFDFTTDWYLADWSARLSLRYLSPLSDPCAESIAGFHGNDLCAAGWYASELDSVIYTDLEASWAPSGWMDGGVTFSLGVNNLLEERPRICYPCSPEAWVDRADGVTGQYWYARILLQK